MPTETARMLDGEAGARARNWACMHGLWTLVSRKKHNKHLRISGGGLRSRCPLATSWPMKVGPMHYVTNMYKDDRSLERERLLARVLEHQLMTERLGVG
mmetsp:Transcript_8501/g.12454  ORF Transcript_8501/g.12454 Transcript_8501/m.12454 type:complete len:99 (-) Transcript_8501:31-327(-)